MYQPVIRVVRESAPADSVTAPLEYTAVGDAGVERVLAGERDALGAANAVEQRETVTPPRVRRLDLLGRGYRNEARNQDENRCCEAPHRRHAEVVLYGKLVRPRPFIAGYSRWQV